jgi:hypothetical protein
MRNAHDAQREIAITDIPLNIIKAQSADLPNDFDKEASVN